MPTTAQSPDDSDICVIVPTIREYECLRAYVANARDHGFDVSRLHVLLVTEDFCESDEMRAMLGDLDVSGEVFDGTRREEWYEANGVAEYGHVEHFAGDAEVVEHVAHLLDVAEVLGD